MPSTPGVDGVRPIASGRGSVPGKDRLDLDDGGAAGADSAPDSARQGAWSLPPEVVVGRLEPLPACPPPATPIESATRVSMEELIFRLVRRVAWAGDRRRGAVQVELGAGRHAGTILTVFADDDRVRVDVSGPGSEDLRQRIRERLERRGIDVESVT